MGRLKFDGTAKSRWDGKTAGTPKLSRPRFLSFIFLLIKKAKDGFRRLLTPFQPLSLTPLNKKIFDFQGYPLWFFNAFKICYEIIEKYQTAL